MSTNTINTVDEVIKIFDKDSKPAPSCEDIKQAEIPEQTEEELIANAFTGDKIKELLSATGPTVKAVLLKPNGTISQVLYDSTPSKNHVAEILGSPPTIIGQYVDLDVIVVGERYDITPTEHELNTHKLRYPFNDNKIYGNIFLYRFNQNCEMEDFTVEEYNEFVSKSHEDIGKVFTPVINDTEQPEDDMDDINADEQYQFMKNVIMNKLREEFPKKFGREPSEEELENYCAATMQMFGGGMEDIPEEEESDGDYNPDDDDKQAELDEELDEVNDSELEMDKRDIECAQNENKLPLIDLNEQDEEAIVNSEEFEKELREAIENVKHIANIDKEKILNMAKEAYMKDTGEHVPNDVIADAFKMFGNNNDGMTVDDEVIEQNVMDDALEHVSALGKVHRNEFIEKISNTFMELNGCKPSDEQLNKILGNIQEAFLDEAMEDFMEINGTDGDENEGSDGDYNPNDTEEVQQFEDDKKLEVLEELEHGNSCDEDEDYDPNDEDEIKQMEQDELIDMNEYVSEEKCAEDSAVKVLVTPVKRKASGSKMGVYLEECDEKKTLVFAEKKFEKINGRKPNENDKERLKEFLKTGMLFESQINVENENEVDDENDEDYVPEKDTFDYSKDVEDDMEYEKEFEKEKGINAQNENDDTSNKIEI